ncbi:MAG: type II toxin-antitoxin system RelE/ParE family toxin [Sphingomonadales bacterium]
MTAFRILDSASHRLDQIYIYTRDRWGKEQADKYIHGLFDRFQAITDRRVAWRPIAAEFAVDGYVCRYERHYVYWKVLTSDDVGIVTVLHERMHKIDRIRDDL